MDNEKIYIAIHSHVLNKQCTILCDKDPKDCPCPEYFRRYPPYDSDLLLIVETIEQAGYDWEVKRTDCQHPPFFARVRERTADGLEKNSGCGAAITAATALAAAFAIALEPK